MSRNIKLIVEYDGTDFHGWQRQPDQRTVQGEMERCLHRLLQEKVELMAASRTDAGVHAQRQIANFITNSSRSEETIQRGLNALLPRDIVVRRVQQASADFHARFGARSREYHYRIYRGRTALLRRWVWEVSYDLQVETMIQAAESMVGEWDFSSFCTAEEIEKRKVCHVFKARWVEGGEELLFQIEANRFLRGMVRGMVGTFVEIGRGRRDVEDFGEILRSRDRRAVGVAAPARGLCLMAVRY